MYPVFFFSALKGPIGTRTAGESVGGHVGYAVRLDARATRPIRAQCFRFDELNLKLYIFVCHVILLSCYIMFLDEL